MIFFYIFLPAFNIDKKLEIDDNQTKSAPTVITLANEILDIIKEDDILLLVGTKYDARYAEKKIIKLSVGLSIKDVTHLGGSVKRCHYFISPFSEMGDKGERGVKNLKKWATSFMDSPCTVLFHEINVKI